MSDPRENAARLFDYCDGLTEHGREYIVEQRRNVRETATESLIYLSASSEDAILLWTENDPQDYFTILESYRNFGFGRDFNAMLLPRMTYEAWGFVAATALLCVAGFLMHTGRPGALYWPNMGIDACLGMMGGFTATYLFNYFHQIKDDPIKKFGFGMDFVVAVWTKTRSAWAMGGHTLYITEKTFTDPEFMRAIPFSDLASVELDKSTLEDRSDWILTATLKDGSRRYSINTFNDECLRYLEEHFNAWKGSLERTDQPVSAIAP